MFIFFFLIKKKKKNPKVSDFECLERVAAAADKPSFLPMVCVNKLFFSSGRAVTFDSRDVIQLVRTRDRNPRERPSRNVCAPLRFLLIKCFPSHFLERSRRHCPYRLHLYWPPKSRVSYATRSTTTPKRMRTPSEHSVGRYPSGKRIRGFLALSFLSIHLNIYLLID